MPPGYQEEVHLGTIEGQAPVGEVSIDDRGDKAGGLPLNKILGEGRIPEKSVVKLIRSDSLLVRGVGAVQDLPLEGLGQVECRGIIEIPRIRDVLDEIKRLLVRCPAVVVVSQEEGNQLGGQDPVDRMGEDLPNLEGLGNNQEVLA